MTMIQAKEYLVNKGQIAKIHLLLAKVPGLDKTEMTAYKKKLVRDYTDGRATSTTKMTWKEAKDMIADLERLTGGSSPPLSGGPGAVSQGKKEDSKVRNAADVKRKKLLHYCHLMSWYEGQIMEVTGQIRSVGDIARQAGLMPGPRRKLDMARVDSWCCTYGKYKKRLMEHSADELSVLITQMERVYKDFLKAV